MRAPARDPVEPCWRRLVAGLEGAAGAAALDHELERVVDRLRALRHVAGRTDEVGALLQRAVDLAEARALLVDGEGRGAVLAARLRGGRERRVLASVVRALRASLARVCIRVRTWQSPTRRLGH